MKVLILASCSMLVLSPISVLAESCQPNVAIAKKTIRNFCNAEENVSEYNGRIFSSAIKTNASFTAGCGRGNRTEVVTVKADDSLQRQDLVDALANVCVDIPGETKTFNLFIKGDKLGAVSGYFTINCKYDL